MQKIINLIFSFNSLFLTACICFFLFDLLPAIYPIYSTPYSLIIFLEIVITLQLIGAWVQAEKSKRPEIVYLLVALLALRLAYHFYPHYPGAWGLRAAQVHNIFLGIIGYGVGLLLLHPSAYRFFQQKCQLIDGWTPIRKKWLYSIGFLFLALLFCGLLSKNISRDGYDWILRTSRPVWFHYVREPLTIGLYRATFLAGRSLLSWTSYQAIATLSILSGLWGLYWFHRWLREKAVDSFSIILGWFMILSSGGLIVLFFGHIEVYPVFIAGLMPTLYWASRYLEGKTNIIPAAIGFSVTSLLHLSTGWLIPAFFLLPFINFSSRKAWRDSFCFVGIFSAIQIGFWGWLMFSFYEGSLIQLLAVIHENFFVGQDQAMLLPLWIMVHPLHLWDLLNEYLYLSVSGLVLLPFSLMRFFQRWNRKSIFWFLLIGGYGLYSLTWNPDRGFPEDWDLFSALPLLVVLFVIHSFMKNHSVKPIEWEGEAPADPGNIYNLNWVQMYIAALGTIPFACAQVWYHHTVPFVMGR